jgi:hypothetical protein
LEIHRVSLRDGGILLAAISIKSKQRQASKKGLMVCLLMGIYIIIHETLLKNNFTR